MKNIETKDFLDNSKNKSLSLYIYSNASSLWRFFLEQSAAALFAWIPTPAGMIIRLFFYKLLMPKTSRPVYTEPNVDIKYFDKIWTKENVFIDRNCRIHSSPAGIHIGKNSRIMYGSYICAFSSKMREKEGIFIGDGCWIGINCVIAAGEAKVEIGNHTLIGPNVTIVTGNHQFKTDKLIVEQSYQQSPISIGEDCWIGANSVILGGVSIGKHCVVAAGAVVNKDVPDNTIVGGIPAKPIGGID